MFVAICLFIGGTIYINSGTPTEDLDAQILKVENIKKVEIEKVASKEIITFRDSADFTPFIQQLIKSEKIKITDTRSSRTDFYLSITFKNEEKKDIFIFKESEYQGRHIRGNNYFYKNDSLYNTIQHFFIDSFSFLD